MEKIEKIGTKEFDMKQFMDWLYDNENKIDTLKLEMVNCLAVCEVKFKEV